jgi:hypothetical protein
VLPHEQPVLFISLEVDPNLAEDIADFLEIAQLRHYHKNAGASFLVVAANEVLHSLNVHFVLAVVFDCEQVLIEFHVDVVVGAEIRSAFTIVAEAKAITHDHLVERLIADDEVFGEQIDRGFQFPQYGFLEILILCFSDDVDEVFFFELCFDFFVDF